MKKAILWGLAGVLALGVGTWFLWSAPFPVRAYERIRLGMTGEEVETAIGGPPTHWFWAVSPADEAACYASISPLGLNLVRKTGGRIFCVADRLPGQKAPNEYTGDGWLFANYDLRVLYDPAGRVAGYELIEGSLGPPTLFDRIRAWLGL
jgi:hypothetical protein